MEKIWKYNERTNNGWNKAVVFFIYCSSYPLCQSTTSFFSWPDPGCMLGTVTHSFINTEPGALWEIPACPLSALATEMQVCLCVCSLCLVFFFWTRGKIIFYGCLIEREQIMRLLPRGCACMNANMCEFRPWRTCASTGIRSQASPRGSQGARHFKGPQGSPCQPARQGGNPVYMARPRLARPAANTALWRLHRLPPPRQV